MSEPDALGDAARRRIRAVCAGLAGAEAFPACGVAVVRNARAATEHACARGLVAQWRARPPASRAVARKLGYVEIGQQVSLRPAEPGFNRTGRAARA